MGKYRFFAKIHPPSNCCILDKMNEITDRHPLVIDSMGKPCPMPLLMLKKQLKQNSAKQFILLKSSDPHSEIDILRYCEIHKLTCQLNKISAYEFHYLIES